MQLDGLLQQAQMPKVEAHLARLLDGHEGAEEVEQRDAHQLRSKLAPVRAVRRVVGGATCRVARPHDQVRNQAHEQRAPAHPRRDVEGDARDGARVDDHDHHERLQRLAGNWALQAVVDVVVRRLVPEREVKGE